MAGPERVVVVDGLPGVNAALKKLAGLDAQRIRERAIGVGSRMTVPYAKSEAPLGPTHNLHDRIGSWPSRARTSGGYFVGRDPNSRIVTSTAPHRHLVIRGTAGRYTSRGAYRGIMPSNPFLDRAWSKARPIVYEAMGAYAMREIGKIWHG